jgi:hypothetical protein
MEFSIAATLSAVRSIAAPAWRFLMGGRVERRAAESPATLKALPQAVFDDVLGRIATADPSDSLFKLATNAVTRLLFTPAFLRTENVQTWLADPAVRADLFLLVRSFLSGVPEPELARRHAEARYRDIALTNDQESKALVDSVVGMFAAGIKSRITDTATTFLMVAGDEEILRRVDALDRKLDGREASLRPLPASSTAITAPDGPTKELWLRALAAASTALVQWPTTVGAGAHIQRPELEQLLQRVHECERGVVALLGLPGSGKSALLSRLAHLLSTLHHLPVLAIKGDLLDAAVDDESKLQHQLGLPELPSTMLPRLALESPVVLLIDQLDALAGHLDVKTGRLSVLLNLVKALSAIENLFVIVSCREFEFTHDVRLSRIDASSVTLQLPPWPDVLSVLESHGVQAAGFNADARELLRVPQHLSMFLQVRAQGIEEPVSTYTALLDRLWSARVLQQAGGGALAKLAFDAAEAMAEEEVLWLAAARFDDRTEELERLKAAGILTASDRSAIGFSHQTVFEHVLARSFTHAGRRLSSYVLAKTDSLLVRPKVWAALAYLRDAEPSAYDAELDLLWSAPGLRKHLRYLLIEFMGSQAQPTDKEEILLAGAAGGAELRPLVLKAIAGSPGWLARFGSDIVAEAMVDDKTVDVASRLLRMAWPFAPERVSTLLVEYWLPDLQYDQRTLFVLHEAPAWPSTLAAAAKTIVARCNLNRFEADQLVSTVGAVDPNLAIDLARLVLDRQLAQAREEALYRQRKQKPPPSGAGIAEYLAWQMEDSPHEPVSRLLDDSQAWDGLPALAAAAPHHFVSTLWPWYLSVLRALLELSDSPPPYGSYPLAYKADFRFPRQGEHNLEPSPLLLAVITAVEALAESDLPALMAWVEANISIELAPVQRLIAHAFSVRPTNTATSALSFLLDDERRYSLGNVSDLSVTTRALIMACAPHWSADQIDRFVAKVNRFSLPRPAEVDTLERVKGWHQMIRRKRLALLAVLPSAQRPPEVEQALAQADRAWPATISPDDSMPVYGSRMSVEQFAKASVDAIANAFKEIPDAAAWDRPDRFGQGGNIQLSREFAEFAGKDPLKAVTIIGRLDPEHAQRAVGFALRSLANVLDAASWCNLVSGCCARGFGNDEFRQSIAFGVERLLQRGDRIDDAVLSVLERWTSPEATAACVAEVTSTEADTDEDRFLLWGGPHMEVSPAGAGAVLASLVRARFARDDKLEVVRLLRAYLDACVDPALWQALVRWMPPLASESSGAGKALITDVLSRVRLEGTRAGAILMARVHWQSLDAVTAALLSWRDAPSATARKGYGELVALLAVANPQAHRAREWLDAMLDDDTAGDARAGAVSTAVHLLWAQPSLRPAATDVLIRSLAKDEPAVWHQVFTLFSLVDRIEPETQTLRLLAAIAERIDAAPAPRQPHVVERLSGVLPRHSAVVARIATRLVQLWQAKALADASPLTMPMQELFDLALTLHRTEGTLLAGLQVFEQLIEIDAYQAREFLDELDHRVRNGARPLRPRLRRPGRGRRFGRE